MELLAHVSAHGDQTLREHLWNVARMAEKFARPFDMAKCAFLCGLVHDLGKSSESFQQHLRGVATPPNYHKDAGMRLLWDAGLPYLAMVVDGHHGGLTDHNTWAYVAQGRGGVVPASADACDVLDIDEATFLGFVDAARAEWEGHMARWRKLRAEAKACGCCRDAQVNFEAQFAVRMLFSCLVDADFLDTECACCGEVDARESSEFDDSLLDMYDSYMAGKNGVSRDAIARGRVRLNAAACRAGTEPRGLRKLSADTGLGKTLASLGFALHSAHTNELRRVIYSIPFNTIADQTYREFREIFGNESVLEATSSFEIEDNDDESADVIRRKVLLTENWNAPLVITSNVQFLESLFANKTSVCRKLHNIAQSVLVFDEVQSFDREFATPTVAVLELLVRDYGCDVLMMSATCPDFAEMKLTTFGTPIQDIEWDNDCTSHEAAFLRVRYVELGVVDADELIDAVDRVGQTLFVVNTRKQARLLFGHIIDACASGRLSIPVENVLYLSNDLCPVTRGQVMDEVLSYLDAGGKRHGEPCVIVSTTLVEAGVDLDAQCVFRCRSGVDSILQAAGRANRHGHRDVGVVYLFDFPDDSELSDKSWLFMREKKKLTNEQMCDGKFEGFGINSFEFWDYVIEGYLGDWYDGKGGWLDGLKGLFDVEGSTGDICLDEWDFARWARTYRLIDDAGTPVFVPVDEHGVSLFYALRAGRRVSRRKLRRYCVSIYKKTVNELVSDGLVVSFDGVLCVRPEFVQQVYDSTLGLVYDADVSSEELCL